MELDLFEGLVKYGIHLKLRNGLINNWKEISLRKNKRRVERENKRRGKRK